MDASLVIFLLVGLVAGWLAGRLIRGGGYGLIGDLVIGVIGAVIGGYLLPKVAPMAMMAILNQIAVATIGAVILLVVLRLVKR